MDVSFEGDVTVRHVRYANEESGWAVLDAAGRRRDADRARRPARPSRAGRAGARRRRVGRRQPLRHARSRSPRPRRCAPTIATRWSPTCARQARRRQARRAAGRRATARATCSTRSTRDPARGVRAGRAAARRASRGGRVVAALRVTRRLHLLLAPHGLAYLAVADPRRTTATPRTRSSAEPVRADERVRRRAS